MKETIERNYLEIKSINALVDSLPPSLDCSINIVEPSDFQINKFFYKNVGKKHQWTDRLIWSEKDWIKYSSNLLVDTYILKIKDDMAGYFELITHLELKEVEIAYLGLFNRFAGGLFGFIKWSVILSALILVFNQIESVISLIPQAYIEESVAYPFIVDLGTFLFDWISESNPLFEEKLI